MASPNHTHRGRRFLPHEPRAIIPFLHRMRKTKIICTLGPATEKAETVRQLIQKGADVFRFNMSHAEHGWVRAMVPRIRRRSLLKRTIARRPRIVVRRRPRDLPNRPMGVAAMERTVCA